MLKTICCGLLLPLALTACASSADSGGLVFSDTEGKSRSAMFMKIVGGGKVAGEVTIDGEQSLEIVRMNNDLSIAVRDHEGKSRAADLKALSRAKSFTLFTFSRYAGTVEVGKVAASANICADYRGKGLKVAIADNMPSREGRVVFRTHGIMAGNKRKVNEAYFDYSASPDLPAERKQQLEQDKNNMIAVHYGRLEEFIVKGICAS